MAQKNTKLTHMCSFSQILAPTQWASILKKQVDSSDAVSLLTMLPTDKALSVFENRRESIHFIEERIRTPIDNLMEMFTYSIQIAFLGFVIFQQEERFAMVLPL